jgi:CrcB protein
MFITTLSVALGGAIGATLRFLAGAFVIRVWGEGFPVAIITVNVIGSFLMGVFVVWSFQKGMTHLNPFVMTGVLGGFTTFSAFSLEAFTLFEKGQAGAALVYVAISVFVSIAALAAGIVLARGIFA